MSQPRTPSHERPSDEMEGDDYIVEPLVTEPLTGLPPPSVMVSQTSGGLSSDSDSNDDDADVDGMNSQELREIIIQNGVSQSQAQYCNNVVVTSRYTFWNFIPKNLFEQFSEVSNQYFFCIGILQLIPAISTTQGVPTIYMPLAFIIFISAIRAGFEDYKRHQGDSKTSRTQYQVYSNIGRTFQPKSSGDISVGDIIMVKKDETIPADMILQSTSDQRNGQAFIDKKSLNGETSLEIMLALRETYDVYNSPDAISHLRCKVYALPPNGMFDVFTGNVELYSSKDEIIQSGQNWQKALLSQQQRLPLSSIEDNAMNISQNLESAMAYTSIPLHSKTLIFRETTLRSTDWAIGIVIYTGKDTKIRQNVMDSRLTRKSWQQNDIKKTRIFVLVDSLLKWMVVLQVLLCLVAGIYAGFWHNSYSTTWYLRFNESSAMTGFLSFLSFFIILSQMVPISLIVSGELVKMFLSFTIEEDHSMYSAEKDERVKCNKSILHEELGQIDYVLSDKTGTLTKNKMEFRFALIMGCDHQTMLAPTSHNFEDIYPNPVITNPSIPENILQGVLCFGKMETEISKRAHARQVEYNEELEARRQGRRVKPRPAHLWTELTKNQEDDGHMRGSGFPHQQQVLNVLWGPLTPLSNVVLGATHEEELHMYGTNPPVLDQIQHDSPWLYTEHTHSRIVGGDERKRLYRYLVNCALSNTVNPYYDFEGNLQYTTESADELALVLFAKKMGVVLSDRDTDDLSVYTITLEKGGRGENEVHYYKKLGIFHFSSERKRVTVICERVHKVETRVNGKIVNQYKPIKTGEIYIMSKGQDTVMMNLLFNPSSDWSRIQRSTQHLCKAGLRTMIIAESRVDKTWWKDIQQEYELLDQMTMDRSRKDNAMLRMRLDELKTRIEIEAKLHLLGASGLEDELQDLVPECIGDLMRAGMKVWMLTGDKKETAKNIALACRLIDPDMLPDTKKISKLEQTSPTDLVHQVNDLMSSSRVLEVTGEWITLMANPQVLHDLFLYFASDHPRNNNVKVVGYTNLSALIAGFGADDEDNTIKSSMRTLFDVYDHDKDGYLDFTQFKQFMYEVQVSPFDAVEMDVMKALKTAQEMAEKQLSVSLVVTKEAFTVICPPTRIDKKLRKAYKKNPHSGANTPVMSPVLASQNNSLTNFSSLHSQMSPLSIDTSVTLSRRHRLRYHFFKLSSMCASVVFAGAEPPMKERMVRELSERCKLTMQHPQAWAYAENQYTIQADGLEVLKPNVEKSPSYVEGSVTLAIGDGANDELMIKAAHIGVGISGVEGAAAVKAADYSIAQFSYLHTLLLVHGVWCYTRVAYLVQFVFYKAALVAMTMFFFGFFSGFSGQQLFNEPIYQFFNILFTAFPVLLISTYERVLNRDTLENNPEAYKSVKTEKYFSSGTFLAWIARAFGHAAVVFFVGFLCLSMNNVSNEDGREHGLYLVAAVIYMCVVFLATVIVFLDMYSVTWVHIVSLLFSISSFFVIVIGFSVFNDFNVTLYGVILRMLESPAVWLVVCVTTLFPLLIDIAARHFSYIKGKTLWQILRESQVVQEKRKQLVESLQNVRNAAYRFDTMKEFDTQNPPLPDLRLYKPFAKQIVAVKPTNTEDTNDLDQHELDGVIKSLSEKEDLKANSNIHLQRALVSTLQRFRNLTGSYFESAEWQSGVDPGSRDYIVQFN